MIFSFLQCWEKQLKIHVHFNASSPMVLKMIWEKILLQVPQSQITEEFSLEELGKTIFKVAYISIHTTRHPNFMEVVYL